MKQLARRFAGDENELPAVQSGKPKSFLKFLMRYPIFILTFGPPIFRSGVIDATKGLIDIWSFLQVGLLGTIAIRAIYRLASSESSLIPKQIRSILKVAFLLGFVFLASAIYSPSHLVSAAYSVLYFLTLICIVEFVADVYTDPPDWIQCLFVLRLIALILLAVALITLFFAPSLVLSIEGGAGVRLRGEAVAPMVVIGPAIALISASSFLYSLESKARSAGFFIVGVVATLSTQTRGAELALFLSLAILGAGWAKTGKRFAYIFISGFISFILLCSAVLVAGGGGRIWDIFNRGQSMEGIESASGRMDIWKFVIQYCIDHPQGMGYIAGFRALFREYFTLGMQVNVLGIGNSHNSFLDVLADAGWLALVIYLVFLTKIFLLGRRLTRTGDSISSASNRLSFHAMQCALILLVFCLSEGMDVADYNVPLRGYFYWQHVIIAIILGLSARLLVLSRQRHEPPQ